MTAMFQIVINDIFLLILEIKDFTKELQDFASKMVDSLEKDANSVSFLPSTSLFGRQIDVWQVTCSHNISRAKRRLQLLL